MLLRFGFRTLRASGVNRCVPHVALVVVATFAHVARAQDVGGRAPVRPAVTAVRAATPPVIDGRDDDPAWRTAPVTRNFDVYTPHEGGAPAFPTEARIVYDDQTLYVLVRAYDPKPSAIERRLARRDTQDATADQVHLFLDPYHDRRTGYEFTVTSAGVKIDGLISNDGDEDFSWDGVWNVATRVDSLGWVAEFAIPFGQLRFTDRHAPTFGIMIGRWVGRTGERATVPEFRRSRAGLASQFGDLVGLADLGPPTAVEIAPYALMRARNVGPQAVSSVGAARDSRIITDPSVGGDVRWVPRPNVTVGLTFNPDFGEVDADPSVLNLTGVEVHQDERRPFFLEGAGALAMPLSSDGTEQLFYSRRIGRTPVLGGALGAPDSPTETTILGAGRMTARLAPSTSLAVLSALTAPEDGAPRADGGRYVIEPRGAYGVARLQHDFRNGRSGFGVMVTHTDHATGDSIVARVVPSAADAIAVTTQHQTADGTYQLTAWGATSDVRGSSDAIARLQLSPVHAFQAPDDGIAFDATRTHLSGSAASIYAGKVGGLLRYDASYRWIAPGFDVNELGFLARAGVQSATASVGAKLSHPGRLAGLPYRSASFILGLSGLWTTNGLPADRGPTTLHAQWELPNLAVLHFMGSMPISGGYCTIECTRGGAPLYTVPQRSALFEATGDPRRALVPHLQLTRTSGRRPGTSVQGDATWRIRSNLDASLTAYTSNTHAPSAFYARFGAAGSDTAHYTVAHLDQYTRSLTARLNYTLATTLTLQWYAEAYVSRGTYGDVRALADSRASSAALRLQPYGDSAVVANPGGVDFRQLRSNTVLRWEYRPGSALFVVWSQGRTLNDGAAGTIGTWPGPELGRIFALRPANTVAVKLSYWLVR